MRVVWAEPLVSSRLLQYELWNRLHTLGFDESHARSAEQLLARIAFLELSPFVLERALEPFPSAVRTLDALHLASAHYLRSMRADVRIASYDVRLLRAAEGLEIPIYEL